MRNEALKETLMRLQAPPVAEEFQTSAAQTKAASQLKIIDLQEKAMALNQKIAKAEMDKKHIDAINKEDNIALKKLQDDMEKERSAGKAVWETVGIQTVSYRDPFHTGLSKRTPTGGFFTS